MKEKGLLAVSFGTSYAETRKKTIEALEYELAEAFPDYGAYRAWTSGMVIRKVAKTEDLCVDTVPEALERMEKASVREILIQPSHLLCGTEYRKLLDLFRPYVDRFDAVRTGRPLLADERDAADLAGVLAGLFPMAGEGDAVVLMGHGSTAEENRIYRSL